MCNTNPKILRHLQDDFYSPTTFHLTADEIATVVEWYEAHIWTAISKNDPSTLPPPFTPILIFIPNHNGASVVCEGYMDESKTFHRPYRENEDIKATHWRPMPDPPTSTQELTP